jgi:cardiolipin synthase
VVAEQGVVSDRVVTVPNAISIVRLAMVPVFAWLIATGHDGWALLVLAGSGASDWLDGVLLVTLLGLANRGIVPWWLVGVLLARELMLLGMLMVLARHGYGPLQVHLAGKAGTFALLYAFPLLLLARWGGITGDLASVFGWAFAWWGIALYWFAGLLYVRQAAVLLGGQDRRTDEPEESRPVVA